MDRLELDRPGEFLEEELRNFREIARHLKPGPGEIPALPGIQVASRSRPLHGFPGGDHIIYIDFKRRYDLERRIRKAEAAGNEEVAAQLRRNLHRAGILIADVAGHRATDALLAAMLHQAFLLGARYELDRSGQITTRLFEHINQRFYNSSAVGKFLTMLYGEIEENGRFRFISAGHPPPWTFRAADGSLYSLRREGVSASPPIGLFPTRDDPDDPPAEGTFSHRGFEVNEVTVASGDVLFLFTDGLAEHADGAYLPEGLERTLRGASREPAEILSGRILEDLLALGPAEDDITLVVIRHD